MDETQEQQDRRTLADVDYSQQVAHVTDAAAAWQRATLDLFAATWRFWFPNSSINGWTQAR